ncbi:KDEL motif-containing protein 2 [Tetrabaena socialis]|uniref:KDEL motif-containing protein 2 n=1 Tax=Tetrabaena socialis TaxID=47790 RepID=A0A2J8A862_9CHLO|nr:KDEL motif-containing protein 2 [Tetrabaena socialis]|eukprot:PNH08717.1 KDEL motif-containing protein 2 [Tetrabaena socialis]
MPGRCWATLLAALVATWRLSGLLAAVTAPDEAFATCTGAYALHPAMRASWGMRGPELGPGQLTAARQARSAAAHPPTERVGWSLTRIGKDVSWIDDAGGITDTMIRNISLVCDANVSNQCDSKVVRIMIKDGEVYLNSLHPEWRLGPHELIGFLLELYETSKLYRLPDVEFAYNGDDDASSPAFDWSNRPSLKVNFHGGPFPLLAWSKSDKSMAQLVPYSGAFRCTDDSFDMMLARLDDIQRLPWDEKEKVAFGRWNDFCAEYYADMSNLPSGERFPCPRRFLPTLSTEHPDLLDISVMTRRADTAGSRPGSVPLMHQNRYRYLVSTDGWAISSKFDKYLLLGSTTIKAASSRYGFYYDALRHGEHHLAVLTSNTTDILDVVRWAQSHDEEAARIAANAQQFAVRHLHRGARLCYYRSLIEELGKRMRYVPDCADRKLCVPLGQYLQLLSIHPKTKASCQYHETLLRYGVNASVPYADKYPPDVLLSMMQDQRHWPFDTDTPPLNTQPYFTRRLLRGLQSPDDVVSGKCAGDAPCDLHPALRARIQKDVEWLDQAGGITDAMIRNISLVCDVDVRHQCNVKAVRIMIKDGEVYLNSLHPDWRLGPHEFIGFLLELYETSKTYKLPDVEFAYNGDDDASSPIFDWTDRASLAVIFHGGPFPLLAWSKSDKSMAQLVPYSGAFRCTDDSFDTMLTRLDDINKVAWQDRKQVAFGRWNEFCAHYYHSLPRLPSGERFPCPRESLPTLSAKNPDLLDIGVLGQRRGAAVPLQHQNVFRYLVSTDGWAISSKLDKYLLLGSTIIKAVSSRYGYYYSALKPGEHYLNCLNSSKDDIVDTVRWAQEHDDEAARIAANAQRFAVRHLHRGARLCYYRTLVEELGKRMRYTPSCSQRKLCIPIVSWHWGLWAALRPRGHYLEFLSTYRRTAHSCRGVQEVLLRHGVNRSLDFPFTKTVLEEMLKDDKFWPRDNTEYQPLPDEPYFPR